MMTINAIGNLGADAEKKEFNGREYSSFRMGVHVRGKDETTWVSVLVYYRENLHQYLRKGAAVYVSGDMRVSTYTKKDNTVAVDVNCFASTLELVGGGINTQSEQNTGVDVKKAVNNSGFDYVQQKQDESNLPF